MKTDRRYTLTPLQDVELWAWYCAKKELGTFKQQAHKMGVADYVLQHALKRLMKAKRGQANRIGARNEVRA